MQRRACSRGQSLSLWRQNLNNDFMNSYLSSIAEELSSNPCPGCGKFHKVSFDVRVTSAGLPDMVFPDFSEDSCNSFKELVKNRLRTL